MTIPNIVLSECTSIRICYTKCSFNIPTSLFSLPPPPLSSSIRHLEEIHEISIYEISTVIFMQFT